MIERHNRNQRCSLVFVCNYYVYSSFSPESTRFIYISNIFYLMKHVIIRFPFLFIFAVSSSSN